MCDKNGRSSSVSINLGAYYFNTSLLLMKYCYKRIADKNIRFNPTFLNFNERYVAKYAIFLLIFYAFKIIMISLHKNI
jgi:hypothetical protein